MAILCQEAGLPELQRRLSHLQQSRDASVARAKELRIELTRFSVAIGGEPKQGETWSTIRERSQMLLEEMWAAYIEARTLHQSLEAHCASLPPGTELLSAAESLQEAHRECSLLEQKVSKARKAADSAEQAEYLAEILEDAELAQWHQCGEQEAAEQKVRDFEASPIVQEMARAKDGVSQLPPVLLHVKAKKGLGMVQTPRLGALAGFLDTEWAMHFPAGDGNPENDLTFPVLPFLDALRAWPPGERSVMLALTPTNPGPDPRYFEVNRQSLSHLESYAERQPGAVPSCVLLLRSSFGLSGEVLLHRKVKEAMAAALRCSVAVPPGGIQAALRNYQLQGFTWLSANAANGIGSLLADDMGLGKTLQAASLLLHLREIGCIRPERPALVVTTFSVLSTWAAELQQWTPTLRHRRYHGPYRSLQRWSDDEGLESYDVLLTTYQVLQLDQEKLCSNPGVRFSCIVLDESQTIKNDKSLTSKAVKRLAAASGSDCVRVALSGTPIENRLAELHSLFEFLNPGFLGAKDQFLKTFERPLKKGSERQSTPQALRRSAEALRCLRTALEPFVLRRLKSDRAIAPELPDKIEYDYVVQMQPEQSELYESLGQVLLRGAAQGLLASTVDAPELEEGRTHQQRRSAAIFLALHRLQQVCNHPAALPPEHRPDNCPKAAKASGKTAKLIELLGAIWEAEPEEGPLQKALIFTQYRGTQDLLVELLQAHFPNFRAVPFHGNLSADERDKAVRDFSKDPHCRTMVLTLKAGGVGLTLTAASHVIHFDRCWNPAKEAQATDRAHRIGQAHTVLVHRITTEGSCEERLAMILAGKKAMAEAVLSDTGEQKSVTKDLASMSDAELRQLFCLTRGL